MNPEAFLQELKSLRGKILRLSRKVESIEASRSVESLLRMRGFNVFRKDPEDRLFFPPGLPPTRRTRFFEMMKKYSFRLVLRDMIKYQGDFEPRDLTHYCTLEVAQKYCDTLCRMGILRKKRANHFRPHVRPLFSFGPTLEWFVAEMFQRELASPALYGTKLKDTDSGGDYDVIASWNRRLVYVEVKSSPPKGIEQNEITTFFSRIDELLPDVAILFNDTHLRMKDKLVVMFEEELKRRYGRKSKKLYPVNRLLDELFHVRDRIFIVNSKRDVMENFTTCLRHYLRNSDQGRGIDPVSQVEGEGQRQ